MRKIIINPVLWDWRYKNTYPYLSLQFNIKKVLQSGDIFVVYSVKHNG